MQSSCPLSHGPSVLEDPVVLVLVAGCLVSGDDGFDPLSLNCLLAAGKSLPAVFENSTKPKDTVKKCTGAFVEFHEWNKGRLLGKNNDYRGQIDLLVDALRRKNPLDAEDHEYFVNLTFTPTGCINDVVFHTREGRAGLVVPEVLSTLHVKNNMRLSYTGLEKLPWSIGHLRVGWMLGVAGNRITVIPQSIRYMDVEGIYFSDNPLEPFGDNIFFPRHVRYMNFSGCDDIGKLPESFGLYSGPGKKIVLPLRSCVDIPPSMNCNNFVVHVSGGCLPAENDCTDTTRLMMKKGRLRATL